MTKINKTTYSFFKNKADNLFSVVFGTLLLLLVNNVVLGQDYKNEKQLIKGANQAFDDKKYEEAIPLFSTLVSNYSKDATYNYKYGASLLYGGSDKEKPIKYLNFAVSRPDVDPIAYFYYAEALHLNYEFDKAIKYYKKFTNNASNSTVKKNTVDNQIRQCENGKTLLKTITDLIVLDEKKTREQDFYKVYDLSAQGGQILVKIDEFRSPYEIKNNINGLFYFPKNANKIFFSSHTFENTRGKDIFYAQRKPDGSWSKPINLGKEINTEFDEDFPYMSADGVTLYFASQGHNSLGGYDIFVSRLDTNTGVWTAPKNLDFAINTPADDYLFIPDASGQTAYFATERQTPVGEVSVYQINMERVPLDFTFIYGSFSGETTNKAKIKVENVETNAIIGEYETDDNGKYKIKLPNDGKFRFLVDYEGSEVTHSGEVDLQDRDTYKPLKQEMLVVGQGTDDEKLIIKNLVDEEVEEDVELTAEFFKEKAKLKINKDKFKDKKPSATIPVVAEVKQDEPTAIVENKEHQGKAASNIADELVIDTLATASSTGPDLTINEDSNSETPDEFSNMGPGSKQNSESGNLENELAANESGGNAAAETSNSGNDKNQNFAPTDKTGVSKSSSGKSGAPSPEIAAVAAKLRPSSSTPKPDIEAALKTNVEVAKRSSQIVAIQSESAQNVADRKTIEAAKLKAEADKELSLIDIETEEGLNSEEYQDAQKKLKEAEALEKQAKIALLASNNLKQNQASFERAVETGSQTESTVSNQDASGAADAVTEYNDLIDSQADESYNIYEEREKAYQAHKQEEAEAEHFSNELAALNADIADSEEVIKQKENALKSAKGKEAKQLEEELTQERAAFAAMQEKSKADQLELEKLEEEAEIEEAELQAFDEIIEELGRNEGYTELTAQANLIDGPGTINTDRSTQDNLVADNIEVNRESFTEEGFENEVGVSGSAESSSESGNSATSETAASSSSETIEENQASRQAAAQNNQSETTTSNQNAALAENSGQEIGGQNTVMGTSEGSANNASLNNSNASPTAIRTDVTPEEAEELLANNSSSSLAVASVPASMANVSKEVPTKDSKSVLFPYMDESDSLSNEDKALLPSEGNETSAFIPENSLAALENEDQSIRTQLKTGYHMAYMEEFFEIAEEEDEYTKAVNTYVLNQSWLLDVDKEISYLESVEESIPDKNYQAYTNRLETLENYRETKLNDLESSKERLDAMEPSSDKSAAELATDFRAEMNRVFEGKGRLSAEEIAELEAVQQQAAQRDQAASAANNTNTSNELSNNEGSNTTEEGGQQLAENFDSGDDGSESGTQESSEASSTSNFGEESTISSNQSENNIAESQQNIENGNSNESGSAENFSEEGTTEVDNNNGAAQSNALAENISSNAAGSNNESTSSSNDGEENEGTSANGEEGSLSESNNKNAEASASNGSNSLEETNESNGKAGSGNSDNAENTGTSGIAENAGGAAGNEGSSGSQGESGTSEGGSSSNSTTDNENALAENSSGNTTNTNQSEATDGNSVSNNNTESSGGSASSSNQNGQTSLSGANTGAAITPSQAAAANIVLSEKGEIIPNKKEDKLAEVLNMENAGSAEAVVTNFTNDLEKKETQKQEAATAQRTIVAEKEEQYLATKKKKEKRVIEAEIREETQLAEIAEKEAELLAYQQEVVARSADNILALEEGEERESDKELKKAEEITVQAETARGVASAKAAEKVRGKKKTRIKEAEVDRLNHEADLLDYEANSRRKLAAEVRKIEDEVLAAEQSGSGPAVLPKSSRTISQAEIQDISSSTEYADYDEQRKQAVQSYKEAQVLYQEKMSLEAQNKVIDAEIQNVTNDLASATDEVQKEELSDKLEELKTSKVENTNLMNQKETKARTKYSEYAKQNKAAIASLSAIPGEEGEKAIALANLAEMQGVYSLSSDKEVALADVTPVGQTGEGGGYSPEQFNRVLKGIDDYPAELSDAIFKMIDFNESLYSEDNPVPMNNKLPTGLVYKVQIGAFRNPPPDAVFKGFAPVRGETTRPGWLRYTAGLFQNKDQAQLKRNEIRTLGYEDAFVVAYLNGERISLSRAKDIETGAEQIPASVSAALAAEAGDTPLVPTSAVSGEVKQLKDIQGLMYTVQVGAFRNQVTSNELFGISPLIEYRAGNLYKYGSGIYNDIQKASAAKDKIISLGVADAFVTAFFNGNRVSMDEAQNLADQGNNFAAEQPVTVNTPSGNNSAGINFRVQLGAYRQEVPVEDAKIILSLSNLGLDTKIDGDLTYYTAGNYGSYAEAKQMQTQVVNQGLQGAFVIALRNGEKMDLQEAIRLTGQ